MQEDFSYLGQSIRFPIQIVGGTVGLVSGKENVEQAIRVLLDTPIGSRFFLPEYGSRLEEVTFEPNDDVLKAMIRLFIHEALEKWETRVKFEDADFTFTDDSVQCIIKYVILPNNEINSFVYPFYRKLKY